MPAAPASNFVSRSLSKKGPPDGAFSKKLLVTNIQNSPNYQLTKFGNLEWMPAEPASIFVLWSPSKVPTRWRFFQKVVNDKHSKWANLSADQIWGPGVDAGCAGI